MSKLSDSKDGPPGIRDAARKARNDVYRHHILEAAEHVFAEKGFEAAKMQDIGERADLSMGTIYAIFPGKTDVFAAILDERGRELLDLARTVRDKNASPVETLRELIAGYIDYFVAHPDFLRMHLRLGTSWILSPATASESQVHHWTHVQEIQADIFRRGIEAGLFIEEEPGYLAKVFSAMDQVLLAEWVESGMKQSRDDLVRRLQNVVERAFRR